MQGMILLDLGELKKKPIHEFERKLTEQFTALKVITGYEFDNQKLLLSYLGDWFSMSIRRNGCKLCSVEHNRLKSEYGSNVDSGKVFTLSLWDYHGTRSVFDIEFTVKSYYEPIPNDVLRKIEVELSNYSNGLIHCSDCDDLIKQTEIAGHHFAGSYCLDCWSGNKGMYKGKGGWWEVEKNETYE